MAHLLAASSIVTGGTTGLISLETTTGSLDSLSEDAQSTILLGGSTTLTSVVSNQLDARDIQTAQAVTYVETYSEAEINELVSEIDELLAENSIEEEKGYTRTLKNKNFS